MRDPTPQERNWFSRVDMVLNKEELDKLVEEVNDPKKGAKDEWKAQILQKAQTKKSINGWND